ncbi:MAG: BrnT family toxin [Magnetococcales bacterium]|nr:BrnT family toxin [Magnetococcales bacterium]
MKIEYDPTKRLITMDVRGLDFDRVNEIFTARHTTVVDDRREYGELRFVTMGCLDDRLVVVVWTKRDGYRRIISMRKANEREQRKFREQLDGS